MHRRVTHWGLVFFIDFLCAVLSWSAYSVLEFTGTIKSFTTRGLSPGREHHKHTIVLLLHWSHNLAQSLSWHSLHKAFCLTPTGSQNTSFHGLLPIQLNCNYRPVHIRIIMRILMNCNLFRYPVPPLPPHQWLLSLESVLSPPPPPGRPRNSSL